MISERLHVPADKITDIRMMKKGLTNRSYRFQCGGETYIVRIPGEGTDRLINRAREAAVYRAIAGRGLCDDPVYLDPDSGIKITAYLPDARACDSRNPDDLKRCMELLRSFHEMGLQTDHDFDLFRQIDFYESLWSGAVSAYPDYPAVKASVLGLRTYIEDHVERRCLAHIDAVPDNFLFYRRPGGGTELQLTDWEYAGMQDPYVDLAMFCIYSGYEKPETDALIDLYFGGGCSIETRRKIYAYMAVCGLLWSNWCEYKRQCGVEFGAYALRQYRYAKEYSILLRKEGII